MVSYLGDGRLLFTVHAPDATQVDLVGAFHGWHEQQFPMERGEDGTWRLELDVGPGEYLFRYLLDGRQWVLDEEAHGVHRCTSGRKKSRAYRPPLRIEPDTIAA